MGFKIIYNSAKIFGAEENDTFEKAISFLYGQKGHRVWNTGKEN